MMDDVDAGKVNCIVTKDLSRFRAGTRDDGLLSGISVPGEAGALHRRCGERGHRKRAVRFRPVQKPVQRVVCKRYEPQGKGRFQSESLPQDERIGAYAPIGYRKHPEIKNKLIIDEETRWIVETDF